MADAAVAERTLPHNLEAERSVLGAILLTGYLGGAVAAHFRVGSPLASFTLVGVYIGVVVWLGLWLRDPRVRVLFV